MTTSPMRVEDTTSVHAALQIMRSTEIRHLPVLKNGKVVGVVTSRDIVRQVCDGQKNIGDLKVSAVMTPDPFTVSPDTPISQVAGIMANHKFGSVLVVDHGKLVGIFTVIDALRVLHQVTNPSH